MRATLAVLDRHLRESLRDPHVLGVSIGFPLIFYPLLVWGMTQLGLFQGGQAEADPPRVLAVGATELVESFWRAGDDDALVRAEAGDDRTLLHGDLDALVVLTGDGQGLTVDVRSHQGLSRSQRAREPIEDRLAAVRVEREAALLGALATPPPPRWTTRDEDVGTRSRVATNLVAMLLPMLVLAMLPMAALYPAVDVVVAERERGTLETTLVASPGRLSLLAGKIAAVVALTLLSLLGNVFAGLATCLHLWLLLGEGDLPLTFQPVSMLLGVLLVTTNALLLAAAVCLAVSPARTFKEGESVGTFVAFIPLLALPLAVREQVHLDLQLALVPVANGLVGLRDALNGELQVLPALVGSAVNTVLAGCCLILAARLLDGERWLMGGGLPRWLSRRTPEVS